MNKKKLIIEIIFFIIVTGLTIYYLIASGVFNHINDLSNLSFLSVFILIIIVISYILLDSTIIYRSMKEIKGKASFIDGVGAFTLGNLGSNITPWKSAHFPMITYHMLKKGYNIEEALSVMAKNQFIYSTTLPILYFAISVYGMVSKNVVQIGDYQIPLFVFSLIGMALNIFYLAALMLLLYLKRLQEFVIKLEMNILIKLKKIKDKDLWLEQKEIKLKIYKDTADNYWKKFYKNLPSIALYFGFMMLINGFPYFSYLVLSKESFSIGNYLYCFMLFQAMSYVTNLIPVPGGMIAIEFSFLTVFKPFMGDIANMALLLYRFCTFILVLIYDFIFFIVFEIIMNKINRKKEVIKEEKGLS